jgi:hypothetical protein
MDLCSYMSGATDGKHVRLSRACEQIMINELDTKGVRIHGHHSLQYELSVVTERSNSNSYTNKR